MPWAVECLLGNAKRRTFQGMNSLELIAAMAAEAIDTHVLSHGFASKASRERARELDRVRHNAGLFRRETIIFKMDSVGIGYIQQHHTTAYPSCNAMPQERKHSYRTRSGVSEAKALRKTV